MRGEEEVFVVVGGGRVQGGEGVERGEGPQRGFLSGGERAAVSGEEGSPQVRLSVPWPVFEPDEVADRGGHLGALEVDQGQPLGWHVPQKVPHLRVAVRRNHGDQGRNLFELGGMLADQADVSWLEEAAESPKMFFGACRDSFTARCFPARRRRL